MPTPYRGTRTTEDFASIRRPKHWTQYIDLLDKDSFPFIAILEKLGTVPVTDPEFKQFTDKFLGDTFIADGAFLIGDTTIDVTAAQMPLIRAQDIICDLDTGEKMLVTACDYSTNEITVERSFGSTAASASLGAVDNFEILANAHGEGSRSPNARYTKLDSIYNYTEIFKEVVDYSNTALATSLHADKLEPYEKMKALKKFYMYQEKMFIFGERNQWVNGEGQPVRATGGIIEHISTYKADITTVNAGGLTILDRPSLDKFCAEYAFAHGANQKTAFCSTNVIAAVTAMGDKYIRTTRDEKVLGHEILQYVTSHGKILNLIEHPYFKGSYYSGMMIVVEMPKIKKAVLKGRNLKLIPNVQENDRDSKKDLWIEEAGLYIEREENFAMLTGVTA